MNRVLVIALVFLAVLALVGCSERTRSAGRMPDSYLGKPCAIEMEFERSAAAEQMDAFRRRVRAIPGVGHVEILPRRRVIELFRAELRRSNYTGKAFDSLAARAQRFAAPVLIATPDRKIDVPAIVRALQELPEAVTSVIDRPSCDQA
jgi:hypothetical protein